MIRASIAQLVGQAWDRLDLGARPESIEIQEPRQPEHGDYACSIALTESKRIGRNPRELAELLAAELQKEAAFQAVEIAGPGFINFRLTPDFIQSFIGQIISAPNTFGKDSSSAGSQMINVEFVSVNPNGPITIGSGRGAAYGSALCSVLEAAGNTVHREYYINDGVNSEQMRLFAESVQAILQGRDVPDNGYKGDYVFDVAKSMPEMKDAPLEAIKRKSEELMILRQREALSAFGVEFDTWFSEQSLHESGAVEGELQELLRKGAADDHPFRRKLKLGKGGIPTEAETEMQPVDEDDSAGNMPTVWLRSTKFGDDMDRVIRRRDGRLTYIASDVAYHKDKFNRPENAGKLITVLGPDHHGYIARLQAVVAADLMDPSIPGTDEPLSEIDAQIYSSNTERDQCRLALEKARASLDVQIFQLVRFVRDGKPAPMRKRDGNIYALIDLINEIGEAARPGASQEERQAVGRDVARWFYLMRSHDTSMDFDLDLAVRQSDENPVFYVQYAHARICAILRRAEEEGFSSAGADLSLLSHPKELALVKKILDLPYEIQRCADDYAVHRLTTFGTELSRAYHHFYDACRVIQAEDPGLTKARLVLCEAARIALASLFRIVGISAPEKM